MTSLPFLRSYEDGHIPADAALIRRAHTRGALIAETLADLHARYDGPCPPSAISAVYAEQARRRRLPDVERIQLDLDLSRARLAQAIGIFREVMRARRRALAALRASALPLNRVAFQRQAADLSAEAKFQFKWVRSGRLLVARNWERLAEAERAAMQQAAE